MTAPAGLHVQCSKCGAALELDGSARTVTCRYCNAPTVLPPEIWHRLHPPPAPFPVVQPAHSGLTVLAWIGLGVAAAVGIGVVAVVAVISARTPASKPEAPLPKEPPSPIASAGELCNGRRAACSTDKTAQLSCGDDEKMIVSGTCKGPNGCRVENGGASISCDTTIAAPKDPCDTTESACSTDRKAQLRCESGHYVVLSTCKGPDGCSLTRSGKGSGYTMSCDDHIADVGDPCFDTTRTACSSDKTALLTCSAQRFALDRKCAKGCTVKKVVGTDQKQMRCE